MPQPKKKVGPIPVEAITHEDKRANLPTADAHDFVTPEIEKPIPLRYPRDSTLDPQLVWKGKDEQDAEDLVVDAPPIYIQEKIDPRVLIENLRRTAAHPEDEPELTLFETFDGLDDLDLVDFYNHGANWSNRMILGDSLNVMASLAEREALRGKVQMIYIDPPYGIKFGSNWQTSARKRDVKDGKIEDASREVEQIKAFRDTWELGIHSYLSYLRDRLIVARDLLTESGSVFVQIGDENVHLVRSLMDEVFGSENFISSIVFTKTSGATAEFLPAIADSVLWFARDRDAVRYRQLFSSKEVGGAGASMYTFVELPDGSRRRMTKAERADPSSLPEGATAYRLSDFTSPRVRSSRSGYYEIEVDGRTFLPNKGEWKTHREGVARLLLAGRLQALGSTPAYVRKIDDFPAYPINNVWGDIGGATDRVYVVQTATRVVERCMLMATDPGDLVLDPTCGSGTTASVAEQWGRRWITIDTSRVALALARQRVMASRYPFYLLADSPEGRRKEGELSAAPLPVSKTSGDVRHGFVCERIQRVTLKSIANNPDIRDGMSREEVDTAIRRHADYELLHDKPYEDKRKVRVAGPFTVESLSPHRSLAFAGSSFNEEGETNADAVPDPSHGGAEFEQSILDNLQAAGIQNGRKGERLEFDSMEPYAASYIQAVGIRTDAQDGSPRKVAITLGPQYGTVGSQFVKEAAKEAIRDKEIDLLCVLGFAFDPAVLGIQADYVASDDGFAEVAAERKLGRVPVLLVRMNADLVMGEDLKKTGAGNLFTVFGEPDVQIDVVDGDVVLTLLGVDVYDPNSGEIRSNDTSQVALWMIDTDYDGESFFVRHCYFTGDQDPYKRLKASLKAEIDEATWASQYRTTSRPFAKPGTGKVAVKVINDYGDEVLKVFDI